MPARVKLHEQVMVEILRDVAAGRYAEGDRLPGEVDLAAKYEVSRGVAREAIQALRDRGVLTVKHGVGATIAPRDQWDLFDPALLEALLSGRKNRDARAEADEIRRLMWPEVAALAAQRRIAVDLERLEAAAETGEEAFLGALLRAAHNRFLRHVLAALERANSKSGAGAAHNRAVIVRAIRDGDQDAARAAMRDGFA
jgi:DNA-binding FadR family transcriptional regulator